MDDPHPEAERLFALIAACLPLAVELHAPILRSTSVLDANAEDFVSGEGAARHGGRWNPPRVRAVYGALDPVTAVKEVYQQFLRYGFKDSDIKPRVIAGLRVEAHRLLDLTNAKVRREIGCRLADLLEEGWAAARKAGGGPLTQAIGRGCRDGGFEGLLVPSAADRSGTNVVLFPDRLGPASTIAPIAADELPPHPRDWPV